MFTDEGFARLVNALQIIDRKCSAKELNYNNLLLSQPRIALNPCDCSGKSGDFYRLKNSINKISLEYVWAYPPGIPIVAKGEVITQEIVDTIFMQIENGINVYSTKGKVPKDILCCE